MRRYSVKSIYLLFIVFLVSCAPSFNVTQTNDKFDDPSGPDKYVGKWNRITTTSVQGGTHIDDSGIYFNMYSQKKDGKTIEVGFVFQHYNSEPSSGFNFLRSVTFINDKNDRVVVYFEPAKSDFKVGSFNTVTNEYNTSFYESGTGKISVDDFMLLARSNWIKAKLIGDDRTFVVEKDMLTSEFVANIKKFAEIVKPGEVNLE